MRIIHGENIYSLINVLAKGNRSEVWDATIQTGETENKPCLIKLLQVPNNVDEKALENEATLLLALSVNPDLHDTLVSYHQSFFHEREGQKYLVLVLDKVNQPKLTTTFRENDVANYYDFMRVAKSVAKAMSYLHTAGLTHGSIRPDNIAYQADTGQVTLLDEGLNCTLLSQFYAVTDANLPFTPLDILELDSLPPFTQRAKHDVWSYALCMFRIATGFNMISAQSTGAIIKALNGKNYRQSRHPNEKVNEFLQYMLQEDPNARPSIYEVLAYLEWSNPVRIVDISRYSHNPTIVHRVLRNMNVTVSPEESVEESCDKIVNGLRQALPLSVNKYSNEYVSMLAEFFGIERPDQHSAGQLCANISNRILSATEILRLRNAMRVIKMLIHVNGLHFKHRGSEHVKKLRRQITELFYALKQEKLVSPSVLRTAWAIESDKLHGQAEMYDYTNKAVQGLVEFAST